MTALWVILIQCLMLFFLHRTEVSDNWQQYPSVTAKPWAIPPGDEAFKYVGYWDGPWYISIARDGYSIKPNQESNIVFAPLYPFLMRVMQSITHLPWHIVGMVVSVLCVLGAGSLLYRELESQWGSDIAEKSLFFLLIFPSSFFLTLVYTEALFLLLAVCFFYALRKKRWGLVALFTALAALTKIWGIALLLIALIEYIRQEKRLRPSLAWFLLPLVAGGSWSLYNHLQFGDWLAFAHGQQFFHRPVGAFRWSELWHTDNTGDLATLLIDAGSGLAALVGAGILLFWKKYAYALFLLLGVLIPLASGTWQSMNRYVLVLFPLFVVLAVFAKKYRFLSYAYMLLMPALLGMHLIQFVHFAWAG